MLRSVPHRGASSSRSSHFLREDLDPGGISSLFTITVSDHSVVKQPNGDENRSKSKPGALSKSNDLLSPGSGRTERRGQVATKAS